MRGEGSEGGRWGERAEKEGDGGRRGARERCGALAIEKLFCKLDTTSLMPVKSSAADDCSH